MEKYAYSYTGKEDITIIYGYLSLFFIILRSKNYALAIPLQK